MNSSSINKRLLAIQEEPPRKIVFTENPECSRADSSTGLEIEMVFWGKLFLVNLSPGWSDLINVTMGIRRIPAEADSIEYRESVSLRFRLYPNPKEERKSWKGFLKRILRSPRDPLRSAPTPNGTSAISATYWLMAYFLSGLPLESWNILEAHADGSGRRSWATRGE